MGPQAESVGEALAGEERGAIKAPPAAEEAVGEAGATAAVKASPEAFGNALGEEVRAMKGGRRAAIAARVGAAGFSQEESVAATDAASKSAFGRTAPAVTLPNGDRVVLSVNLGEHQPVFVVRPDGRVFPARATISVSPDMRGITVTNVVIE
jgi:hypothetical protein